MSHFNEIDIALMIKLNVQILKGQRLSGNHTKKFSLISISSVCHLYICQYMHVCMCQYLHCIISKFFLRELCTLTVCMGNENPTIAGYAAIIFTIGGQVARERDCTGFCMYEVTTLKRSFT